MHELGAVVEVVNTVEKFVAENRVEGRIETLVLQIGELSSLIPKYIEAIYPAAVNNTILADAKLEIEILPGDARCADCGTVFNVLANKWLCPACGGKRLGLLCGKEFFIKEIAIAEHDG
jgi:hydrogenase nickel incorporation protein HypA/HybF